MIELEQVLVRPMGLLDVSAVRTIDIAVYSRPWSTSTWRNELRDPHRHHLVAVSGDDLVGHAGVLFVAEQAHVTTVAVDPSHQGRGVATRLVLDLLTAARIRGMDAATLEVRAADGRAQRIYARLGFAPSGIRHRYYSEPPDDAVIMWLPDLADPVTAARHRSIRSELARAVPHHG